MYSHCSVIQGVSKHGITVLQTNAAHPSNVLNDYARCYMHEPFISPPIFGNTKRTRFMIVTET